MSGILDPVSVALSRSLTWHLKRHNVLASNVANADTPGYTPTDLSFEDRLANLSPRGSLRMTSEKHFGAVEGAGGSSELVADPAGPPGLDGNTVSLERELGRIAENNLRYDATARALRKKFAMLRYAISEGGE
jgi:flagellar basal-body rod protein FlgB